MRYEAAKVETFIDLYVTGLYTLKEMCLQSGFSTTTYYWWKQNNPEFQKKLKDADKIRVNEIKEMATRGLMRGIEGGEYEETVEEFEQPDIVFEARYSFLDDDDPANIEAFEEAKAKMMAKLQPILKRKKVMRKVQMANAQLIQFALRNVDKETFPDTTRGEIGGPDGKPISVAVVKPGHINTLFPSDLDAPADEPTNNTTYE